MYFIGIKPLCEFFLSHNVSEFIKTLFTNIGLLIFNRFMSSAKWWISQCLIARFTSFMCVRSPLCESSFSINCHIWDFNGNIGPFCLDIQAKVQFLILSFSLHIFRFFNTWYWFEFSQVHLTAVAPLPNILWFYFLYLFPVFVWASKCLNGVGAEEDLHLCTSDPFHLSWSNDFLRAHYQTCRFAWIIVLLKGTILFKILPNLAVSQLAWVHTSP